MEKYEAMTLRIIMTTKFGDQERRSIGTAQYHDDKIIKGDKVAIS